MPIGGIVVTTHVDASIILVYLLFKVPCARGPTIWHSYTIITQSAFSSHRRYTCDHPNMCKYMYNFFFFFLLFCF